MNQEVRKADRKMQSCSVSLHKKMRQESISSNAIWGLVMQSVKKEQGPRKPKDNVAASVFQGVKSRRVLQKTKKLIFYCAREKLLRKYKGEKCESKKVGRFICKRTNKWGQRSRYGGRGQRCLLSLDDLNSVYEWSDLEPYVKDVILEIRDAILECIISETVSELIDQSPLL